jgi:hypothetical protein
MFTIIGHDEAAVVKVANEKMTELKDKYWEQNKHSFYQSEEQYKSVCYWHLHDTQVEVV